MCMCVDINNSHNIYSKMGIPILRFLGRLLFITILLTSAYLKLTNPQSHTLQFNYGYSSIRKTHSIFNSLPDSSELSKTVPIPMIIKAIAGYEIVTALLILIGDTYGGLLLEMYLLVSFIANYGDLAINVIRTQSLAAFKGKQLQIAFWGIMFGFSLVFMSGVPKRRRSVKA